MRCKFDALIIGGLEVLWSAVVFLPSTTSRLALALQDYGIESVWGLMLLSSGILCVTGAMLPYRNLRHVGLWLSAMVMFPTFGVMVQEGIMSIVSLSIPFLGIMALVLWANDVRNKPREKMDR